MEGCHAREPVGISEGRKLAVVFLFLFWVFLNSRTSCITLDLNRVSMFPWLPLSPRSLATSLSQTWTPTGLPATAGAGSPFVLLACSVASLAALWGPESGEHPGACYPRGRAASGALIALLLEVSGWSHPGGGEH